MNKTKLWPLLAAALLLSACSLAQAEGEAAGDAWVGFYVYPTQGYGREFYDNPNLEEYGSSQVEAGALGALTFPQEALFAVEDEVGNYIFPGLEGGYSLFYVEGEDEARDHYTAIISNMGPHETGNGIAYRDEGSSITLSGAVYYGPPLGAEDWDSYTNDNTIWHYYNVYQTPEGRVYLNGHGDSTNGPMSKTQTETRARHLDGEMVGEETVSVTVAVEAVPRLDRLTATQFDGDNRLLQSEDLSLTGDRGELHCLPETAWILVEEHSPSGVERYVYNPPEEGGDPVSHDYVLLNSDGYGRLAFLHIYAK